jgi:putative ABC transport system permease protein
MLELRNIKKTYHAGGIETRALDGISVAFPQKEFVAILGKSGSGKTTCLNIIGGLDRYDSGELIFKGKNTVDFQDKDWDAYRNNTIGFVFQSYNLIMHLGIVDNVELGMTLSGIPARERHKRALEVLEQVGLKEHLHKKPNQLSGGQMQRVAIARALANNPEILLCDEPTGALDTATSAQIMDLIKQISHDRLVIMVTHNQEIAEKYATRVIRFQDGKIISDSRPYQPGQQLESCELKKTSMRYTTALRLSFRNLLTKKGRTFLTALASSIGIIGIAVILSLSTGFRQQIEGFQRDTMSEFPIIISQASMKLDENQRAALQSEIQGIVTGAEEYVDSEEVFLYDPSENQIVHTNIITDEYIQYLNNIDPEICRSIGYARIVAMNMVRNTDGTVIPVSLTNPLASMATSGTSGLSGISGISSIGLSSYPEILKSGEPSYLEQNYELLEGAYPEAVTDLVLVVDTKNRIDFNVMKNLGFKTENIDSIKFEDIVGTEFKIVSNDDYYQKTEFGSFVPSTDYQAMYDSPRSITVRISGIVRKAKDARSALLASGLAYSDGLSEMIINNAADSEIVKAQQASDKNVITMQDMDAASRAFFLAYLGGSSIPYMIMVYPDNFEDKDAVLAYLDAYNEGREPDSRIIYTDMAGTISKMTRGIMDGTTIVLIAFAAVSLVVSLIMIAIITYTSVLERTKEIGVLRALGARKKDITRVFDAETCILGIFAGVLGVAIAYLLTIPINQIMYNLTDLKGVADLQILYAVLLVVVSTLLTMLGGHIPARMAANRNAVEALRSGE